MVPRSGRLGLQVQALEESCKGHHQGQCFGPINKDFNAKLETAAQVKKSGAKVREESENRSSCRNSICTNCANHLNQPIPKSLRIHSRSSLLVGYNRPSMVSRF